jgi:DNA polymerase-3 subunit epsilon
MADRTNEAGPVEVEVLPRGRLPRLLAIDFETADQGADSACALGAVRLEGGRIAQAASWLIRPPRPHIAFSWLHGITWADVAGEPDFAGIWPELAQLLEGCDGVLAHNAGFDRAVLRACCAAHGLEPPPRPFICTVRLARAAWGIHPTRLPNVCHRLGIGLRHHDALSDAMACARIAATALAEGFPLARARLRG